MAPRSLTRPGPLKSTDRPSRKSPKSNSILLSEPSTHSAEACSTPASPATVILPRSLIRYDIVLAYSGQGRFSKPRDRLRPFFGLGGTIYQSRWLERYRYPEKGASALRTQEVLPGRFLSATAPVWQTHNSA